jgi:FixJ family two-component response regulator
MPKSSNSLRVFVVDDDYGNATSLAMILRHHGFNAISFDNPDETLQAAGSQPPDLLIADVVMPSLSGIDLAIQVQQLCPNCKVLLLSGRAATAKLLESARARGHDLEIILKPVHPLVLLEKIHMAFEFTS